MSAWVTRTVLSGSSIDANGTASHTCTFTPATAGNFLVAIVAGGVTFTTPSGWTLLNSAINMGAVYIFTKTASGGESSFTTTHNGSNYPVLGVIYEFPAGVSALGNSSSDPVASIYSPISGPTVTGLTGAYTRVVARCTNLFDPSSSSGSITWVVPSVEDFDTCSLATNPADGVHLSIAYDDYQTASSFTPNYDFTGQDIAPSGEAVAFALSTPPIATPYAWMNFG